MTCVLPPQVRNFVHFYAALVLIPAFGCETLDGIKSTRAVSHLSPNLGRSSQAMDCGPQHDCRYWGWSGGDDAPTSLPLAGGFYPKHADLPILRRCEVYSHNLEMQRRSQDEWNSPLLS